jgi:Ca-activated chloride channel homolog
MVMIFWWATVALLVLGLVVWGFSYLRRDSRRRDPVVVANSSYLESLASYRRAQTASAVWRWILVVGTVVGLLGAAILSGRVADERVETPTFASRDIVLCLDVSGSMYEYDTQILSTFADMVDDFEGERVGLSIFNSTSRTVFPLTNDYALVESELRDAAAAMDFDEYSYYFGAKSYTEEEVAAYYGLVEGTRGLESEASLTPDGLASCNQLFDRAEEDRSRSIILASDNEVNGEPIFTLAQAAEASVARDIQLFSLYPGTYDCPTGGTTCGEELQQVTEDAGGHFHQNSDPDAIPAIIQSIQRQQAVEMGAAPQVVRTDLPGTGFVLTLVGLIALLLGAWRSRR